MSHGTLIVRSSSQPWTRLRYLLEGTKGEEIMGERKRRAASGLAGGDWTTTRFNAGTCLHCGEPLTGLTGPAERPIMGAFMVCGACGYVMEWDGEKNVEVSDEAMAAASADPHIDRLFAITRVLRKLPFAPKRIVMLEPREPEICEECGKLEELRPYGHKKADGKRKWICFPCAHKDEAEMERAFDERMRGENEV